MRAARAIKAPFLTIALLAAALTGTAALASEGRPEPSVKAPCAVMDKFEGDVQVLDSTRTKLIETTLKTAIPCGGWVSVRSGNAEVHHRQGYVFRLGPGTFAEFYDNRGDEELTGPDHVLLFKGSIHADVPRGSEPLRVVTSNARARMAHGAGLVIFDQSSEETQLISLRDSSTLENRYAEGSSIEVKEGEATSLNFKLKRVVPETPAVVSMASLRQVLKDIPLDSRDYRDSVARVRKRIDRLFAEQARQGRSPASAKGPYGRHPASDGSVPRWHGGLTGGYGEAEKILFPEGKRAKARKAEVLLEDPAALYERQKKQEQDKEKERLIRALSGIGTAQ